MKRWEYWLLFGVSVLVAVVISAFQETPGYMDADYYFMGGIQLAEGKGFSEPVIWNYLNDPQTIPQPSHQYWMPMASIIAAGGMVLFGSTSYWAGRFLFILIAGLIPVVVSVLSTVVTKDPRLARLSGAFAIASGYYAIYFPVTESFGLYMLGGALFFLLLASLEDKTSLWRWLGLGLVSSFMALTRADGTGFIVVGFMFLIYKYIQSLRQTADFKLPWLAWIAFLVGVSLPMGSWMVRNWLVLGQVQAAGAYKTLWLTSYNQLFVYPTDSITFHNWLSTGWSIIIVRLTALGKNLLTLLVVQGGIVLLPLILAGAWKLRKLRVVQIAGLVYGGLLLGLTVLFPFPSERGGFFHSGAAMQPMLWVLAVAGIKPVAAWVEKRGIKFISVNRIAILVLSVMVISTIYVTTTRLFGIGGTEEGWNTRSHHYAEVDTLITNLGGGDSARVAVSNPPSYWVVNRREAIVIPDGSPEDLMNVAQKFGVTYLVLEQGHSSQMDGLYAGQVVEGLTRIGEVGTTQIYRIGTKP